MRLEALRAELRVELENMGQAGTLKQETQLVSPQSARVKLANGHSAINLCANNYLGLADDPEVVAAAQDALARWGFGLASVRFIVGTHTIHSELEQSLSEFLTTEATILYSSCFDANAGLFETLLGERDVVLSDALNHASIIDGIRLCRARRLRYRTGDMDHLEALLRGSRDARRRLIATDGVFSMDGYLAKLDGICELADRYEAIVMVDDSHATGFMGPTGRGTPELFGVGDRVDIYTGTLGKALGGANGGYVSGRREIVEVLRQRSRPYLFSNSIAPSVAAGSAAALRRVVTDDEPRCKLHANARKFRDQLSALGFAILPGVHPIVPVMFGDARTAGAFARRLLDHGVFAVAFSFPVVPDGAARIRTQVSAAHTPEDLDEAAGAFAAVRAELATVEPHAFL